MSRWLRLSAPAFLLAAVFVGTTLAWWLPPLGFFGDTAFQAQMQSDRWFLEFAQVAFLALHFLLSGVAAFLVTLALPHVRATSNASFGQHLYDCALLYVVLAVDLGLWLRCREGCGVFLYSLRATWALSAPGGIVGYHALTARLRRTLRARAT
jgi:hypothetical protein